MIIIKRDSSTEYICSICNHKHVINTDGTSNGEPFQKHDRKIISYNKMREENTCLGKRMFPYATEYEGYVCPVCKKIQIDESDAYDININLRSISVTEM